MKTRQYTMIINASDTLYVKVPLSKAEFSRKHAELLQQAQEANHPDFPVEVRNTTRGRDHVITYEYRFTVGMTDITLEEAICEEGYCFLSAKNRR